jgi:hypothetical protein
VCRERRGREWAVVQDHASGRHIRGQPRGGQVSTLPPAFQGLGFRRSNFLCGALSDTSFPKSAVTCAQLNCPSPMFVTLYFVSVYTELPTACQPSNFPIRLYEYSTTSESLPPVLSGSLRKGFALMMKVDYSALSSWETLALLSTPTRFTGKGED